MYKMHGATKWLLLFCSKIADKGVRSTIYCVRYQIPTPFWFRGEISPLLRKDKGPGEPSGIRKLLFTASQLLFVTVLPLKIRRPGRIVYHAEQSIWAFPLCRILFRRSTHIYYCYQPPRELYDMKDGAQKQFGLWYRLLSPLLGLYKILDRAIVRRMDYVLSWSPQYADYIRSIYGDIAVHLVPAGVDYDLFETVEDTPSRIARLREEYKLGPGPVLLMVSNLSWKKNISQFIGLVASLKRSVSDLVGIVIGEGPEEAGLRSLARELGIEDALIMPGYVGQEELPVFYQACSILYFLEHDGAWTMATIEAGAAMKPVIVAAGGSMETLVKDGETGYIVPDAHDLELLEEKTLELVRNPEKARRFGRANYEHSSRFSAESAVRRFYDDIICKQ
jgi:glycosyltransferase involved in cell wall biosynthesis